MALCLLCAGGVHNHNRYGANAPEVKSGLVPEGAMAECGSVIAKDGPECTCTYREPGGDRRHCPTCRCGVNQ